MIREEPFLNTFGQIGKDLTHFFFDFSCRNLCPAAESFTRRRRAASVITIDLASMTGGGGAHNAAATRTSVILWIMLRRNRLAITVVLRGFSLRLEIIYDDFDHHHERFDFCSTYVKDSFGIDVEIMVGDYIS